MHNALPTDELDAIASRIRGFLAEEKVAEGKKREDYKQEVLSSFRAGRELARVKKKYGAGDMARLAKLAGIKSVKTAYKYANVFQGAGFESVILKNPTVTKECWRIIGMTIAPLKDSYFGMSLLGVFRTKASTLTEDQLLGIGCLVRDARNHLKTKLLRLAPTATIDENGVSIIDFDFDLDDPVATPIRLGAFFDVDRELDRLMADCNLLVGSNLFPPGEKNPILAAYEEKHGRTPPKYRQLSDGIRTAKSILRERQRDRERYASSPKIAALDNFLMQGDSGTLFPRLGSASVSLIIIDPFCSESFQRGDFVDDHDVLKALATKVWVIKNVLELAKPKLRKSASVFVFFPLDYADLLLARLREVFPNEGVWQILIWDRKQTKKLLRSRTFPLQGEAIIYGNIGKRTLGNRLSGLRDGNIFSVPMGKRDKQYKTNKPIELLRRLIELTTDKGDIVLDCFGGVGATGIACNDLDRRFVLFENNPELFRQAKTNLPDALG